MSRKSLPFALLAVLSGCHWPGHASFTGYEPEGTSSTSGATSGSTSENLPTTADDATSASTASSGEPASSGSVPDDASTTSEPISPPAIVERWLAPDPLTSPGVVDATVIASNASGVRMQVDSGDVTDLAGGPTEYAGVIPIYTGLSNGTHYASFVAYRDGLESAPEVVPFEVALDQPGEGYVWESAPLIGNGAIAAVAALPGEDAAVMVEWGTYYPQGGEPRCYLRQRDEFGAWGPTDFVEVLPDIYCIATDLEVGPDGALYTLATRKTDNKSWWWLGRINSWANAATPENVSTGDYGDVGSAVALGANKIAVCGTHPIVNPNDKIDAAVWVVGKPVRLFDYDHDDFAEHNFDETLRDCIIEGSKLVAVGDAHGYHQGFNEPKRRRHLQFRLDLDTDDLTHHVGAELGAAKQSVANAVAVDGAGRVVSVGYLCGDACEPEATLWAHAPDGTLSAYIPLGADLAAPFAVSTSPAGYVVVAGARRLGPWWSTFWLAAYFLNDDDPFDAEWIFEKDEAPQLQYAAAVDVGPDGHVYGGGVGANQYPAVVYVHP